ncbi:MAG: EAL domain-containing protein [Betaproteobacteria bacterium]
MLLIRVRRSADGVLGWIEDVSAIRRSAAQLHFAAWHDPLTGLLNRRALHVHLAELIAHSTGRTGSLAYLDLDGFKQINDVFGHAAGDSVLRQFATRLRLALAPGQIAARLGGDEFVIVFPGWSVGESKGWISRFRQTIAIQPFTHFDHEFSLSFSAGHTRLAPALTPEAALEAADGDCAQQKAGANPIAPADAGRRSSGTFDHNTALSHAFDLRRATLESGPLGIRVQPIFEAGPTLQQVGEAWLLRLRDATGRVLLPADFLPAARRRGMAAKIDLWVIRQALRQLKPHSAFPAPTEFCLVKLSAESLHDHRFQHETLDLLQAHPGAACRLRIDLNGRYALRLSRRILDFVDQLQQCGSRVVLTGWMALPVWMPDVVGLRPAAMKLDVSTLASGPHRAESLRCIQTLVDACRDLQIETCAARVESQEVLAVARETGFDQVQGYLFGRPGSLQAGSAKQEQAASS